MRQESRAIRVTLRWIQIMDTREPVWRDRGQFRFAVRVTAAGPPEELRFPERGYYEITDQPPWNRVVLNRVIYAGNPGGHIVIEVTGEELDLPADEDPLESYRREFTGSGQDWVGSYEESLRNWRISYVIEHA